MIAVARLPCLLSTGAHVGKVEQPRWRIVISANSEHKKRENMSTFSSSISTDLLLHESPAASFDQYLSNQSRVFYAMFPDKEMSQRLNEDEWRIQMLPLEFLFLSVRPVIDIRLRCKSQGKDYPPGVPFHVSRVLELEATRWELQGLDGLLKPDNFALVVRGSLYSERQEICSRFKGQLELSISCILPRVLTLVPDDVLGEVSESVLKRLVENMKQTVNERLLLDFNCFVRERLERQGEMKIQHLPRHIGNSHV